MQTDIDRAMTIEADIFDLCFATEDQKEGREAFVEKGQPVFKEKWKNGDEHLWILH